MLDPVPIEEGLESEAVDSEGMSGSVASFLANEKLMSLDSMNSDVTGIMCISETVWLSM